MDWQLASEISADNLIRDKEGNIRRVETVEIKQFLGKVYNLTVENDHTYFVGEELLLAHNSGPCILASSIDVEHIIRGGFSAGKKKNKVVGWHSRHGGYNPVDRRISGRPGTPDGNGIYEASIEILNKKTGKWVPKNGVHTFFPDDWSPNTILNEIRGAYNNGLLNKTAGNVGEWTGVSPRGVTIRGFIDSNGRISTAFPVKQ